MFSSFRLQDYYNSSSMASLSLMKKLDGKHLSEIKKAVDLANLYDFNLKAKII